MEFVELYLIFLSTVLTFLSLAVFKLLIKEKKEKRKKKDKNTHHHSQHSSVDDDDKNSIKDTLDILNKDTNKLDRMAGIVANNIDLNELAKKIISEANPSKKEKDRKIIEEALK